MLPECDRSASSAAKLAELEADFADAFAEGVRDVPTQMAAGRIFRLDEGVWTDAGHVDGRDVVRIRIFGSAYFRLLQELPELRPVFQAMNEVLVAGGAVSVHIGSGGLDDLSAHEMEELVSRFREAGTTR